MVERATGVYGSSHKRLLNLCYELLLGPAQYWFEPAVHNVKAYEKLKACLFEQFPPYASG